MEDERTGPLGCGCAVLPGMVLGLILFVVVGLLLWPAPAIDTSAAGVVQRQVEVGLSEEYLGRLVSASLGGGPLAGLEVDSQPGGELTVYGQATVKLLGAEIGLPVRFSVKVSVAVGRIQLSLADSSLGAETASAETAAVVDTVLVGLAVNLQREMERALGSGWSIESIETQDDGVVLLLTAPEGD